MIKHKTKTLAVKYECSACSTVFRKEDLQRTYNLSGLGKYTVQPDIVECPFCYADLTEQSTEIVEYPAPVARHKEIAGLLKRKYQLEKRVEQAGSKRILGEGAEVTEKEGQLKQADKAAVASRLNAQHEIFDGLMDLVDVDARLEDKATEIPYPTHLPATVMQNCLSAGVTINPQIDWNKYL